MAERGVHHGLPLCRTYSELGDKARMSALSKVEAANCAVLLMVYTFSSTCHPTPSTHSECGRGETVGAMRSVLQQGKCQPVQQALFVDSNV